VSLGLLSEKLAFSHPWTSVLWYETVTSIVFPYAVHGLKEALKTIKSLFFYMYSLTKNLDKKDILALSEYIPGEFYKWHRELNAISKILREKGHLTHIRLGNNDCNLYSKQKYDNTKWINFTPYKLTDEITGFEIGLLPTIEVNKKRKSEYNENNEKIVKTLLNDIIETVESENESDEEVEKSKSNNEMDHDWK